MKKISLLLLALGGMISLISCKKFLTVNPKTEMPQDQLFNSEAGFKDALTGVYIQLTDNGLYGGAMTQTTIEQLASSWDVDKNSVPERLGLFNYTDEGVESALNNIYAQEFGVIASVNAILEHIDARRSVFVTTGMYEAIKSECLAIRAFCHFDVLRLFGPVPLEPANGSMLPYVTSLSTSINPRIPFATFKTALLKDLQEAENLVKDVDPMIKYDMAAMRSSTAAVADDYLGLRYLRMNYYAIKALQARILLWFGDEQQAYASAKVVLEAKASNGSAKFRLGTATDMNTSKDYVLTSEHMFALYDFEMSRKYTERYGNGALKKGTQATVIKTQLFGNTGTDIRESGAWALITALNGSRSYVIRKYEVAATPERRADDYKQIPLLRISEMFLIAAETAPLAEGQAYWAQFRTARNISVSTLPADPVMRKLEILKEFRKEFYGEGQSFFAYKRLNAAKANFLFAPLQATPNYLIPLPKIETTAQK